MVARSASEVKRCHLHQPQLKSALLDGYRALVLAERGRAFTPAEADELVALSRLL